MKPNPVRTILGGLLAVMLCLGNTAFADDASQAQMSSALNKLEKQMADMQRTIDAQNNKIRTLETRGPAVSSSAQAAGPVEAPKIDPNDFNANLYNSIGEASKWLKGLAFKGDFRLRYEALNEQGNSSANDRNRFRYRLRFGFIKTFSEEFKVGFRLASGPRSADGSETIGGITSTNQTFDNNFDFKAISIDQAYATYIPNWAKKGIINQVEITGGKFSNPFTEGSSIMIWDGDVTPEGLYEKVDAKIFKSEMADINLSFLAGQFILEEGSGSEKDDAELYAYQGGFKNQFYFFEGSDPVEFKHLASYYAFKDYSLPGNFQATNGNPTIGTRLASGFALFEIYNEMAFKLGPLPKSSIFFDWAKNLEDNANVSALGGQDSSWGLGYKLGKADKKGTWGLSYEYYNIEANAVPGTFNDSDFGHSDRRGSVIRGAYAITDNLQFNAAMFFTNRISSARGIVDDAERDLFQMDLVWKI